MKGRTLLRNPPNDTVKDGKHVPERKCILTGRHDGRDALVRLALGPDGRIAPDVRARAPGRGAWIGVDRPTLEAAQAKGKLRGALVRAFRGAEITIPDNLGDLIEAALQRSALDRLGLEAKSGKLIAGSDRIEVAARRGQVRLLIHAADAAEEGRRRLDQAWRVGSDEEGGGRQGLVFPLGRAILSLALGRENVVHVAIVDGAAATRVGHAIERWRAFIGRETGLGAAAAQAPGERVIDVGEGLE